MKEKNSKKLNKLNFLLLIALILFLTAVGIYFWNFNNGFSTDKSEWGAFGDFLGGTLNPLFAFLSLFAILYTIKIQTQELEYTREELQATKEELAKSRIAQEEQSNSFKKQNASIEQQTFENTFFKLLEFLETRRNDFKYDEYNSSSSVIEQNYHSFIQKFFYKNTSEVEWDPKYIFDENCKSIEQIKEKTQSYYEKGGGELGPYFRVLFNILKFVDTNRLITKINQLYINLIKDQLSRYELLLLFYYCLSDCNQEMSFLIKKYQVLEHLEESLLEKEHQNIWHTFRERKHPVSESPL